jgi:hypothetical protein
MDKVQRPSNSGLKLKFVVMPSSNFSLLAIVKFTLLFSPAPGECPGGIFRGKKPRRTQLVTFIYCLFNDAVVIVKAVEGTGRGLFESTVLVFFQRE